MSQTITKASGNITSPRAAQTAYSIGTVRRAATIFNERINGQPDDIPVATAARCIIDANDQPVADYKNLHPDARGVVAINNATQDVIVSGLALGFTPIGGSLVIIKALATDTDITVSFVGAPTADGFTARLSAATGNANYKLTFNLF
jgi:hypothetical protein